MKTAKERKGSGLASVKAGDSGWRVARSQDDAEALLSRTRSFHDAFVRVVFLDSGTHVNDNLESIEGDFPSIRMLVQTQWADTPAIEFFFEGVESVEFASVYDRRGSVRLAGRSCEVCLGGWRIASARMHFRFGSSEDLGPGPIGIWDRSDSRSKP